ncbi:MAG: M23 family metallopeptidase [Rhodospirillales bacterium]
MLALLLPLAALAAERPPFELEYPMVCPQGQRCPIMVHVDHDPGSGIKDFTCGTVTYDGHSGIDFRVEDLLAVAQGVPVVASAPGVVTIIRDDVPDHNPFNYDQEEAARSSVCGNRVVVSHGPEWSTHYCHLRMGAAPVSVGQEVEAGDVLGYVGMSGSTNFPHFQLNLLHTPPGARIDVDPFAPEGPSATCSTDIADSLWSRSAQRQLAYEGPAIANLGWADRAVNNRGIENGTYKRSPVEPTSEALVFYARTIGIQPGDIQRITILSPDGSVLAESETDPAERDRLQSFIFVGRRLRSERWPEGTYIGFYEVLRGGRVVLTGEEQLYLP